MIVKKKCHKKVQTNIFYQNRRVLERIYKIYKRTYLIGKKPTFFNAEPTNFGLYLIKRFKKKKHQKKHQLIHVSFLLWASKSKHLNQGVDVRIIFKSTLSSNRHKEIWIVKDINFVLQLTFYIIFCNMKVLNFKNLQCHCSPMFKIFKRNNIFMFYSLLNMRYA